MQVKTRIALTVPQSKKPGRYFEFRLQTELDSEPSEYAQPSDLLVISDIEGNFHALCRLLIKSRVIDRYFRWTFGEGHLIINGDCFDRGDQVTECLWLIYSLEEKARKKGGYVHFILGNHEIMNLNDDWRYVHPKYAISSGTPCTALYYGNDELWRWLCTKNVVEKVGNILFVHGGISPVLVSLSLSIQEINTLVRPYYSRVKEGLSNSLINTLLNSEHSPIWYRGYYTNALTEGEVNACLSHFNVKMIVTGHTLVNSISTYFNNKVININTDHATGSSEALLISKNKFYRMTGSGKRERIM